MDIKQKQISPDTYPRLQYQNVLYFLSIFSFIDIKAAFISWRTSRISTMVSFWLLIIVCSSLVDTSSAGNNGLGPDWFPCGMRWPLAESLTFKILLRVAIGSVSPINLISGPDSDVFDAVCTWISWISKHRCTHPCCSCKSVIFSNGTLFVAEFQQQQQHV